MKEKELKPPGVERLSGPGLFEFLTDEQMESTMEYYREYSLFTEKGRQRFRETLDELPKFIEMWNDVFGDTKHEVTDEDKIDIGAYSRDMKKHFDKMDAECQEKEE